MNLGDILSRLYERLNYQSSPASAVTTRLRNAVNDCHRRILREPGLSLLRDTATPLTFASVANQAYYGLPASIERIRKITERDTDRVLSPLGISELRLDDPGLTNTGSTPWAYVPIGYRPIQYLPASTGVWAVSSSAADTTQTVQAVGLRSGGLASGDLTNTLNGTTRVALGSITDLVDITSFSISAVGAGTISLYDAATLGNVLAQIPIGHTYSRYFGIQLYPTPGAAITYYVDGSIRIVDMDDADDVPLLPEEFHDLLVDGAIASEYEKADDPRIVIARERFATGLRQLKHAINASPDDVFVLGRSQRAGYSRLGAWTPAE